MEPIPKPEAEFDEQGLPRELWPYRDEMKEWARTHMDDIMTFLEYRDAVFKLVFGKGFYHEPRPKPDVDRICLDVPRYKEYKDSGNITVDQIFFSTFHEIAHLKMMWQLDLAGKYNQLEQFLYEKKKIIRDKEDPTKFVNVGGTYRYFNNVLEDAIVNNVVLDTRHFSASGTAESKRRSVEVKKLYTDIMWALYKEVGDGEGSYAPNPDPEAKKPLVYVGKGNGKYERRGEEDYEKGFDFNTIKPPLDGPLPRSSQFLVFFMHNQMSGLKVEDVYDKEKNPQGKFKLNEDVSSIFTRPLTEVYTTLLGKVVEKYKNDPAQMKRYVEFMSRIIKVNTFKEQDGKIVEGEPEFVENVIGKGACSLEALQVNVPLASFLYKERVKQSAATLGVTSVSSLKWLDVFNQFKQLKRSREYSWTFPLKFTLAERSKIMRSALEPIYTLLCILDDDFDVSPPPETTPELPSTPSPMESQEKPEWKPGDKVIRVENGVPNKDKKGIITDVKYDATGKVISVTVEYYEPSGQQEMAAKPEESSPKLSGEIEEVFDPYRNLKLIAKKGQPQGGSSQKDPRQPYFEEEEEKEDDGGEDGQPSGKKKKKKKTGEDKGKSEKEEVDLDEIFDPYEKALRDAIARDEREANLKKVADDKKTPEYQAKIADKARARDLLEKLKRARRKENMPEPQDSRFADEEVIKKYQELEKLLAPYAERMAQNWLEIVKNIANRIEVTKDKYYRSGKMDIKKLQKYFPEIEFGREVDQKLIYERVIEKIIVELRPKMLRLSLLLDDSGSMSGKIDNIRMAVMLLNSSLRSFRILFRDMLRNTLGSYYHKKLDVVCDTEMRIFGQWTKRIKDFQVKDFKFLEDENLPLPEIDPEQETIDTLLAFQKITANQGDTMDGRMWEDVLLSRDNKKLQELLKNNHITEAIFQVSDGQIKQIERALPAIQALKQFHIAVGALAIGGDEAFNELVKRHGTENVERANDVEEIVDEFGKFLKRIVKEQVEKPMEDYLDNLEKTIEQ